MRGRPQGGRAPTARTIWQRALVCVHERAPSRGEGTHKGCPYGPNDMATSDRLCTREGAHKGGGHPQGAPLRARTIWQRAIGCAHERAPSRGRAPTRGAPTARTIWQRAIGCAHERAPSRGAPTARTIWLRGLVKLAAISWLALSGPRCGRRYFLEYALCHPRRETAAPRG